MRDPGKVAPGTRARIAAAIEALGYIPNLSASSLASRRSGIVGLLLPTIGNSIFAETVQGLADAVGAAGLQLLLGDFGYSDEGARLLMRALIGRQPEALVVIGVVHDIPLRDKLQKLALPVVETWDLTENPIDTVIGFSNENAGAAMAHHLLARGHRRLAFIGGTDRRSCTRAAGFAAALVEADARAPFELAVNDISIAEGCAAMAQILAQASGINGVFCATDILAVGCLLECQRRGLAVPTEMAIVGLGDLEIARELTPALTTISVSAYEIGRRAGEIVLCRLAGSPEQPCVVDLGFSILARDST